MGERHSNKTAKEVKYTKSYFDVLGVCCAAEASLVEKILLPLEGIQKVSVIVPSKTVIVVHDPLGITQLDIANALNKARLEATIRVYGNDKIIKKWPSPYIIACGTLLIVSFLKQFCDPLKYLAVAAVAVGLPPIIMRSIAAIRRFTLDINILLLIAVGGAIAMKDYTEAALTVFLFTIAEWLETMASLKATSGMSSLMSMAPQKAVLAETGQIVDVQDVKINTILAVKAGEVVPIDGIVVEGRSEVDEKSLTGESFPVTKQPESLVWAGTMNLDGYISVKTTALAENSAVAKMTRLVEEAQNRRSKAQKLIESCAKYYTPAVVVVAAGVALIPLIRRQNNEEKKRKFNLALVLLVSACPCALVLSTPVATFCALVKAARTGLLIKGGDVLEALATTKVAAFDKTGTITKGEFIVVEFQSLSSEVDLRTLLYWVSSVESKSSHPMAAALVDYANSKSIKAKAEDVTDFHIYPGEGIHGQIGGRNIYIGNKRIAARASCETDLNMDERKGVTKGYIFSENVQVGTFALSDTCRTGTAKALKDLKSLGIRTAMLTGDTTEAAMHAQNQIGHVIEEIHAELLPEDKVRLIEDLKSRYGSAVMVGDGLNDAPALASANVGISMGISGSAVAMETSHVTLMSNDICKIPKIIKVARKTYWKIVQNIFFSVITKFAIVVLAFANHPILWAAVLADVGTCLLVILNSMMLLKTKTIKEKKCCDSHRKTPNKSRKHHHNGTKSLCQSTSNCSHKEDKHCHGHDTEDSRQHSKCNVQENSSNHIHCGHQSKSSCGHEEDKHYHCHDTEGIRKHSKCNVQESLCQSASDCGHKEDKHCHSHDTEDLRKHSKCDVQESSSHHIHCGQLTSNCSSKEDKHCHGHGTEDLRKHSKCNYGEENSSIHMHCGQSISSCSPKEEHCHGHDTEDIRKPSKCTVQENSSNHIHYGQSTSNCSHQIDKSCHGHNAEEKRKHSKCNGQENSSNHIHCCQGSVKSTETTIKNLASANKSTSHDGNKNENRTCCRRSEERDDCKNKVSFSSSDIYIDIENQKNGECCTAKKNECCIEKQFGSSTELRAREITGNCCRNCAGDSIASIGGFSVGSVTQLHEIISE